MRVHRAEAAGWLLRTEPHYGTERAVACEVFALKGRNDASDVQQYLRVQLSGNPPMVCRPSEVKARKAGFLRVSEQGDRAIPTPLSCKAPLV